MEPLVPASGMAYNDPMTAVPNLLVVEDNPLALLQTTDLLQSAGYQVRQARDTKECLARVAEDPPDLLLMDVVLPDGSGEEICRKLKADLRTRHIFVVLISSIQIASHVQVQGLEAGADGYIARPIQDRELLARIQAMVRIQQTESKLRHLNDSLEQRVEERTQELSLANTTLRTLSRRLLQVQETERRFLACELHDQIGQLLTGLKLLLQSALNSPAEAARVRVTEAIGVSSDLLERVRQLSLDLRPQLLDDLGLVVALNSHFARFGGQTGVTVAFHETLHQTRLPREIETTLFRVTQEALTNIARHSGVKQATVRLLLDDAGLQLEISDSGRGFELEQAWMTGASTGLSGMRERVEWSGGRFDLRSKPGGGTCISVAYGQEILSSPPKQE